MSSARGAVAGYCYAPEYYPLLSRKHNPVMHMLTLVASSDDISSCKTPHLSVASAKSI